MAKISRVETFVYRVPIAEPIITSFGTIPERLAVFVRIEDSDGAFGWGEVWANFPSIAPEYRARLFDRVLAQDLLGLDSNTDFFGLWTKIDRNLHILGIQSGDPGAFAAALAGADIALHDLGARRAGMPLWKYLGGVDGSPVPVYGSGINPGPLAYETVEAARQSGHRAFKLKIGFGEGRDLESVGPVMKAIRSGDHVMVDINQAYDVTQACSAVRTLGQFPLAWIEEPIAADRPSAEWAEVKANSIAPIAAGENLRGFKEFDEAIAEGNLSVIQPDMCKWGGVSATLRVARKVVAARLTYCPHFLAGGVGLIASLHLLAAVRGKGLLEMDVNPNVLREELVAGVMCIKDGCVAVPDTPGIGITPDLGPFSRLQTLHTDAVRHA